MLDDATLDRIMSSLGGTKVPHRDGTYWLFSVGEVVAELYPFSRNSKGMLKVGVAASLSQPELSRIANLIMKRKSDTWCQFEYHQTDEMIPVKGDVKACLIRIVKREIEHLASLHMEDITAKFEAPYPSVESSPLEQKMHLAVLVHLREVRQLTEYLNWFKQGKRYNFKQPINKDTIEAALTIASA
jgi:hypothetical protein